MRTLFVLALRPGMPTSEFKSGVMLPPHSQLAEGYDLQFHTNVTGK